MGTQSSHWWDWIIRAAYRSKNRAGWVGLGPQLGEGREELVPAFCHSFRGMGKDGDGVSAAGNPPQSHVPIWWEKALWQDEADIVAAVLRLSGLGIVQAMA